MVRTRKSALGAALALVVAVTGACTAPAGDTSSDMRDTIVDMLPNLPPVPVDFNEQGEIVKVAGLRLDQLNDVLSIANVALPTDQLPVLPRGVVPWLMDSNVQHVTFAIRDDGMFVAVNGQMLPAVWWDEASMESVVDVLQRFERDGETAYLVEPGTMRTLEEVLPLLPQLGLRVDLRFPVAEGRDRIPEPDDEEFAAAFDRDGATGTALQTIALNVQYEELPDDLGWVPSLSGFSTVDLNDALAVAGLSSVNRYRLRRDLEQRLENENIDDLGVQLRSDGLFVTVDGELLPHLAWSDETLANVSLVLEQLYPDPAQIPETARWVPVVRALAPLLNDLDISLAVSFPLDGSTAGSVLDAADEMDDDGAADEMDDGGAADAMDDDGAADEMDDDGAAEAMDEEMDDEAGGETDDEQDDASG